MRLIALLRMLGRNLEAVMIGGLGIYLMFAWWISPVPHRDQLAEVNAPLVSYSIEPDQSWFARLSGRRSIYVLFKVANRTGRFWNDAVGPNDVRTIFPHVGVQLAFYVPPPGQFQPVNGDALKTYGLSVDGFEIRSVGDALAEDEFFAHMLLPPVGMILLGVALYVGRRKHLRASGRGEAMRSTTRAQRRA